MCPVQPLGVQEPKEERIVNTLFAALIGVTILLDTSSSAEAARIDAVPIETGPAAGRYYVNVDGRIEAGDEIAFNRAVGVAGGRPIFVALTSPGGNTFASLTIGRAVHQWQLSTIAFGVCASGCAAIWLAGNVRYVDADARIGFHATADKRLSKVASTAGNAMIGEYYAEIGIRSNSIVWLNSASPTQMLWLTPAMAAELGIEMAVVNTSKTELKTALASRMRKGTLPSTSRVGTSKAMDRLLLRKLTGAPSF
jgi:hypothetical protein